MSQSETICLSQICGTCVYLLVDGHFQQFFSYMYIIVPTLMYKEGKLLYQADR
jgi:hypothetical protein